MTATVFQAYQFALDPTPRTQASLTSHTSAARFAYNWALELAAVRLEQQKAGMDVQVPWTLPELRREWNRTKHQVAPWWADNSKTVIANPRPLEGSLRKLRRLNRQLARRTPGSRGRRQTRRRLARVHARAANLRRDGLHELTTALATQHGAVVVERLNVAGMLRNRRLARAISDTGMTELRRQLGYKTTWYGCRPVVPTDSSLLPRRALAVGG